MKQSKTNLARSTAYNVALSLSLFCFSNQVMAHMTTYKGGISFMQMASPNMAATELNYSFSYKSALVYRHLRWLPKNSVDFETRNIGQANFLLKRWYHPDYQGNLNFGLGYGDKDTSIYQLEADWESRSYYILAEHQVMEQKGQNSIRMQKLRLGAAPYIGESGDLHSWLIFQYAKNEAMADPESLTPFLRLYYQSILFEIGYSFDSELNFNLMTHF